MTDISHKVEDVADLSVDKAIARKKKQYPPPRSQQRRKKTGPTVTQRILQVAAATKERRGISLAALKKALSAKGYDVSRNNTRVNQTVKNLVRKGSLVQTAGIGASGSFRFNRSRTRADTPALALGGPGAQGGGSVPAALAKEESGGSAASVPKKISATKATAASSKRSTQAKASATKKGRGAAATRRRKAAPAKPRKAAPSARRKLKATARRANRGRAGGAARLYKSKPFRLGAGRKVKPSGANVRRRQPPGGKPKRPVGRPRKYPPFVGKRSFYARR
ncbi:histone H1-like [Chiloscyllium plagiosum]|uniref:histone H1-like n=1 Tax=Chiloscyllium plagiosum TaxID=36176 RepID=UPI001CB85232|nr:histone H1-like [Chiloscyllium plagiosum]